MAAGDLTTLAAAEAWLGVASDGGGPTDTLIQSLVSSASAFVLSWLSRNLFSASYTERYMGNGRQSLVLANEPITAVSSVSWMGTTVTTAGDPIAGTPGFYFSDKTLNLWGYCLPRRELVQVSYTAGYATIPLDIVQVVNELVGEAYRRRDRIGQVSKTLGGQETVSFSTADMNANAKTLLNQYRAVAPIRSY